MITTFIATDHCFFGPDLAGLDAHLDDIVPNLSWELTGSEDCLEILRQDARRLAAAGA